jgi:lantibiotic transport system permease protein
VLFKILVCEWKKIQGSSIWVPILAAPLLTILIGVIVSRNFGLAGQERSWLFIYNIVVHVYAVVLLPIVAGIIASLICRHEHLSGGWKQLFVLPIRRTDIYVSKFIFTLLILLKVQVLVLVAVLIDGLFFLHITDPIPWHLLIKGFIGGWVATIPLAALQLWVSSWWRSFGTPFALNIVCTIPSLTVSNSIQYAQIYPWTQPMLAMSPLQNGVLDVTPESLVTITVGGLVFIIGGWLHFINRDLYA